jgi:hypothetical protein
VLTAFASTITAMAQIEHALLAFGAVVVQLVLDMSFAAMIAWYLRLGE